MNRYAPPTPVLMMAMEEDGAALAAHQNVSPYIAPSLMPIYPLRADISDLNETSHPLCTTSLPL
ncbi:MAG: hypothetical protein C4B59_10980 [Candidatus Methanogaster sp.]|uniref:Uncharacterized protein n=1 Tax=Candidatus Methanogaster sp. TaxID=3386292 RepID=A0AC61L0Q7_9EURY|nr:MAG: hypothetical protein C4B59_10980 [ANME-2 cluster archaeon]